MALTYEMSEVAIHSAFRELERLLTSHPLPVLGTARTRFATASEFMLMAVEDDPRVGTVHNFKHSGTRRYIHIRDGKLDVPSSFGV